VELAPLPPSQRAVGDLADQPLHEAILALLGRAGVDVAAEQLTTRQRDDARCDVVRVTAAHRRERLRGERLPDHGRRLQQRPIARRQRIQARRDEGVQRLRHGQLGQIADGTVHVAVALELPFGQQHAHRLDQVQRDPVGASQHPRPDDRGESWHQPRQQLAHVLLRERLQQ
jgi:hypothetical protein